MKNATTKAAKVFTEEQFQNGATFTMTAKEAIEAIEATANDTFNYDWTINAMYTDNDGELQIGTERIFERNDQSFKGDWVSYKFVEVCDADGNLVEVKVIRGINARTYITINIVAETEENVEVEETTTEQVAEVNTMNAVEKLAEIKAEQDKINDAQVYYYTTNRGNVYTARYGETGSTPRGKWYTCHEIAGLSEQNVISLATETESGEFVNMLCKFIATETDGSEENADTNEVFSLLPTLDEVDEDDDTDEPEILDADKWVNLYFSPAHEKNGSTYVKIGDNKLSFSRHGLYSITDERHGFELKFSNGKKLFYTTGFHTGIMNSYRHVISAKKVIETYMNHELAAEQEKNFRNFFLTDARKNSTGFYNVVTTVTFADDVDHNYGVNFDKFSDAQAFVEEVKNFVGNVPAYITIRSHQNIYYHRTQDGSETYNVDPEQLKLIDEYAVSKSAFNVAVEAEEKAAATVESEPTGKMKWAAELLDDYTYEFEGDWEAGNGGLARHYKHFNRDGEHCGKVVEVFTDKTSFILDHVNIVDKSIRTYYYINGEKLSYLNGEFNFIWSDKYKAGVSVVGGRHLQVEVPDGQWKKYKNFMVDDDEFFQILSERGACSFETEPPEIPATVAPVETNLTDKYQAALEGVYVEDEAGDFVPAAGMTNVATDNLMVYRKGDSGFMEEDPDKYVELLDMEEELEDVMMDKKIAEGNHKLDEAGLDTEVFSLLPTLEETDEDDETDEPEILNADIWVNINHSPQQDCAFVTVGTDDLYFEGVKLVSILNDAYDFRLKFTPFGRKQFSYRGEIISAKKVADIYMSQLAAKEAAGELKLPLVDSFTVKRDRLIAERDAANAKLKRAEEALKAAKLAAFNADDAAMNFMEDAVDELRERIDLPDEVLEVKTMEGNLAYVNAESVYVNFDDTKFTLRGDCSELNGLTLGTYDTPKQVMTAVEKFKAAIERGDKRFDFNQKPDAQNFNQALVA